jgi:predicted ATPase
VSVATATAVEQRQGAGHSENDVVPRPVASLVGRSAELAELQRAVDSAAAGTAAVVVIGGDAGVGKTRVVAEATARATDDGALVLVGHCLDLGEAPPPYLAFTEALARLEADPSAAEIMAAHPALSRLLPTREGRQPDEPVDRRDLFESAVAVLATLGAGRPVLLVIEDLHWADRATTDLLGYLFTRLAHERVAVVGTFRADDVHRRHPLRPVIAEWSRLPIVRRLDVTRLSEPDMAALVRSESPGLPDAAVTDIIRRADGNPFFAEELLAAA